MQAPSNIQFFEPKTERLQLRQWRPSDLDSFFAMSPDAEVMKYFPSTLSRQESDRIAKKCQSLIVKNGWGVWAVELLKTKEFIGIVGLHNPTTELPCSPCVEILWRIARPYWRQGYATEAATAALRISFEELNLEEVVSFAVLENVSSLAVMQKLNMANTVEIFKHPDVIEPEHLREQSVYRISRKTWAKNVSL
jgi:RimJ/RimL family protein N-acetyltransferase